LNFKALEGGGLTKAEEIEKLELDKSRIIDSIQQEIEATRKRMAEGIGYGRVGKEIGELMGIEAQAPSNWATHPDVQALMEKIQLTASAFDAKIDQIAAAP
jgi:predicted transposase YdaD